MLSNLFIIPVPPDDKMCSPSFVNELKDLKINDGDTLTLVCTVKGDPEPQVTWFKNDQVRKLFLRILLYNGSKFLFTPCLCASGIPYVYLVLVVASI